MYRASETSAGCPGTFLPAGVFLGEKVRCTSTAGLTLTEYRYRPSTRLRRHGHECAYFSLVTAGEYTERLGRKSRARKKLSMAFHPRSEEHSDDFAPVPARTLSVELSREWTDRLRECEAPVDAPLQAHSPAAAWIAMRIHREALRGGAASALVLEGLALELAGEFWRTDGVTKAAAPPHWLRRTEEELRARFREDFSLQVLAREVHVHPVHLARSFRRWYGRSCGEFVRELRVRHAQELLLTTQEPPSRVAQAAGYYDQSHMARCLKRQTGQSPAALRKAFAR